MNFRDSIKAPDHKTSPIVWHSDTNTYLGGRDDTLEWARKILKLPAESSDSVNGAVNIDPWNPEHGFTYDLVVIGGGSGGLACSKEAAKLGANVAVLDYVKPSPHGSKWGLGGTCVNVGCIPKKLMHAASLHGENAKVAKSYGWVDCNSGKHDWESLKNSVQDHIKGLNFGYRVQLREQNVTYLNKLGKFISAHEMEVTDAKGKTEVISAARFVICTGGRPTPLDIPGGELAITSDDIFMHEKSPGKTCVVGAGYVALECAGFLAGLENGDVTVLVRSKPLRTFDQDCVKYIVDYMTHQGVKIVEGVLPKSIEKLPNGRLLVKYGESDQDEFDTVLAAVGRTPDLSKLGLENLPAPGIVQDAKSHKIVCTNEQTSLPHIYAIGDVVHDAPELTPVAILAGKLLSRRLFGGGDVLMDYSSIATAVFTPLEFGTVGLTEDEAIERLGADSVECYVSAFTPLEWTISEQFTNLSCYCKVVLDAKQDDKVIGMHLVAPNAGEIIQGFGLAMNKGITFKELVESVGIHPTVGEEFNMLSVLKSSGASIAKTGC